MLFLYIYKIILFQLNHPLSLYTFVCPFFFAVIFFFPSRNSINKTQFDSLSKIGMILQNAYIFILIFSQKKKEDFRYCKKIFRCTDDKILKNTYCDIYIYINVFIYILYIYMCVRMLPEKTTILRKDVAYVKLHG